MFSSKQLSQTLSQVLSENPELTYTDFFFLCEESEATISSVEKTELSMVMPIAQGIIILAKYQPQMNKYKFNHEAIFIGYDRQNYLNRPLALNNLILPTQVVRY
jgi:hypothetical protein